MLEMTMGQQAEKPKMKDHVDRDILMLLQEDCRLSYDKIAKEQHCMGCGLCEDYCIVSHSKSKDIIKPYNRENPQPTSRIN